MESKLTVGLDTHPDSLTVAIVTGVSARESRVGKVGGPIELSRMEHWFKKQGLGVMTGQE